MAADESNDDKTQSFVALTKDTTVSHYTIIDKIGSGGMGDVYLAWDTQLDRKVALKFLPPHLCQDEDCRKRFKREAQAAAKLSHPNIITVFEVSDYQGRPFFAMEHVEGRSLKEHTSGRDLTIEQILELAIQICGGLHAAHEEGVTHRDIKPSNILIDSHGRARIVDFGLASVRDADHLTKTGSTMGTIGYMSPEQVQGKEVDHRSDLFSLGVVLYELITKQNPFKRDSEAATLRAVSDDHPEPLARFKRDIPEGMQAIIDKALEKDVSTRYQHADGLCSDLMRVKRSLESTQTFVSSVARKKIPEAFWWVGVSVVVMLAIVLFMKLREPTETVRDKPEKIMLAVLPFENLGDPDDEYFADGVANEISAKLGMVAGLGTIGRLSASKYKGTDKSVQQIGNELGVEYLLVGTIRWQKSDSSKSRVRIIPELIRTEDASSVWTEIYEDEVTGIFAAQASVAGRVAAALDITLADSERNAVDLAPTTNLEAYDYYLRGNKYLELGKKESRLSNAIQMYQKAIEIDPEFAMAYIRLSVAHTEMYWQTYDLSYSRLDSAEAAINAAYQISPDLPEIRLARGIYYFRGLLDYRRGVQELRSASHSLPNSSLLYFHLGSVLEHLGEWEQAEESYRKAIKLDPENPGQLCELASLVINLRRFKESDSIIDLAIEIQPDYEYAYGLKIGLSMFTTSSTGDARRILEDARSHIGQDALISMSVWLDIVDHQYESALITLVENIDCCHSFTTEHWRHIKMADCYRFLNNREQAQLYYDSARALIEDEVSQATVMQSWNRAYLAYVYAALGRREDAMREGNLSVQVWPVSQDATDAPVKHEILAWTYTLLAEYDLAVQQLEYSRSIPAGALSLPHLKSAYFEPLRGHPRFEALIEKYEEEHGT